MFTGFRVPESEPGHVLRQMQEARYQLSAETSIRI
jgi:hypothetical protein